MTSRKYYKIKKKLTGSIKLLSSDEPELSSKLESLYGEFYNKYQESFPVEEKRGKREHSDEPEIPKTTELAFMEVGDELKYGMRTIGTDGDGFDLLRPIKKTKKLLTLISEYGADVIIVRVGHHDRDRDRLYKMAEKCDYILQSDPSDTAHNQELMIRKGVELSK